MAENVHYPAWQNISHDQPTEDGISGTINYELTNDSPLLVGESVLSEDGIDTVNFFQTPDSNYAIPGTSIKGLIRNWIEIVTHSKLNFINDTWLSYRDLHNKEYTNSLSSRGGSQAGWLKFEDGFWRLYPAELTFVKSLDINALFGKQAIDGGRSAQKIYGELGGLKKIGFTQEVIRNKNTATKLSKNSKQSPNEGWLIVTGQVQRLDNKNKSAKKNNYIFSAPKAEPLAFKNEQVIQVFLDIVGKEVERSKKKSEDKDSESLFSYLKKLKHEHGVPVFYVKDGSQVSHIGLSKMFRFAYDYSIGQLRHDSHLDENTNLDFSELLFGAINDDVSRKGRTDFSLATCETNCEPIKLPLTTLGAPKSSFYPAYIEQTSANGKFNTYNQNQAKLSGFKRYGVHTEFNQHNLPSPMFNGKLNKSIAKQLLPLPSQQSFVGKVRFHNLKPQELGAILYALKMTERRGIYHSLGMGKPLGLGKVKFQNISLQTLEHQSISIENLLDKFEHYIQHDTQSEETLAYLTVMQSEHAFSDESLEYISFPAGFTEVKKTKGEERLTPITDAIEKVAENQKEHEQQLIREAKQEAKKQALNEATEDEKVFIDLQQMLEQVETEQNASLIKNIAKEMNGLHKQFSQSMELNDEQRIILTNLVDRAESLEKPKINAAIKKIRRDILN